MKNVGLRITLLIFMRLTAERDNLMRLYVSNLPYTWPPFECQVIVLFIIKLKKVFSDFVLN